MPEHETNLPLLFSAALEINSPDERNHFLDQQCEGNEQLRQQLDELLAVQSQAVGFLSSPPPEFAATELGASPNSHHVGSSILRSFEGSCSVPHVALKETNSSSEPMVRPKSDQIPQTPTDSRYQLQGEIARGGMGAVLLGRDIDLGRRLAVKVLLDSHKEKPEIVERFIEEAQIGGQLQHPGIAPVYELGQFADKRPFFTMKLVEGKTLSEMLADRDNPEDDLPRFLGIFEQVCQTIAYAHSRKVIHRDLKPSNIMVGSFGEVQVMDWGLAKVLHSGGIADESKAATRQKNVSLIETIRSAGSTSVEDRPIGSQTRAGSVMGTPAYMPPEQAMGDADSLDERADVFGLGAILCEILTGSPPYVSDDGHQLLRMAMQSDLTECRKRLAACSAHKQLVELTKLCLLGDAQERPRNANSVSEKITEHLESTAKQLRQAEMRRKLTYVVAASLILFVMTLGAGGVWLQAKETEAAKQIATAETKRAEEQLAATKQQQDANEELQQVLYASEIQLAHSLIEAGNVEHATSLLKKYDPQPGEKDRRGFEWHFLDRLCNRPTVVGKVDWVPPSLHQLNLNRGHLSNDWKRRIGHSIINEDADSTHHRFFVVDMDSNEELWSHEASFPKLLEPKWTLSSDGNVVAVAGCEYRTKDLLQLQIDCWDLSTGKQFSTTLPTTLHQVKAYGFEPDGRIQLSPDGRLLTVRYSTAAPDGPLKMAKTMLAAWEFGNVDPLFMKRYDESSYVGGSGALQFSHDGSKILSALTLKTMPTLLSDTPLEDAGELRVMETLTGQTIRLIPLPPYSMVHSAQFSPDGLSIGAVVESPILATTGGQSKTLCVWDVESGRQRMGVAVDSRGTCSEMVFSPDGSMLCVMPSGELFDGRDGSPLTRLATFNCGNFAPHPKFSPDGRTVEAIVEGGEIRRWRVPRHPSDRTFTDFLAVWVCSSDGSASARVGVNGDGEFLRIDRIGIRRVGKPAKTIEVPAGIYLTSDLMVWGFGHDNSVFTLAVSETPTEESRQSFLESPPRGSGIGVEVWSVESGKPIGTLWTNSEQESMLRLVSNPARPRFAGLIEKRISDDSRRQRIAVFDSDTLEVVTEIEVQDVVGLVFSPDGKSLLVESHPNAPTNQTTDANASDHQRVTLVTLFDADSGQLQKKFNIAFTGDRTNPIAGRNTIVFRPDGRAIATLNPREWSIDVWDLRTQTKVQSFNQTKPQVQFAWSLNGDRLISMDAGISGRAGGEMKVWDTARGNALLVHSFSILRPLKLARLPDENRVFAYGWGPLPIIWDGRPIED